MRTAWTYVRNVFSGAMLVCSICLLAIEAYVFTENIEQVPYSGRWHSLAPAATASHLAAVHDVLHEKVSNEAKVDGDTRAAEDIGARGAMKYCAQRTARWKRWYSRQSGWMQLPRGATSAP